MAESQSGASSSVIPKQKTSLLDEDIGKEFFSSWKSMSVTDDDPMDFNFETADKGKKKTFNFEKLNMDFNLDGDFDKISSFKVDMPDLDFSCPPKKNSKLKERSEEESTGGNHQKEKDCFNFSFDFNNLDNFNFDSSLMEGDSNKYPDSKGTTSERSERQGSRINLAEGFSAIDDSLTMKLPASESVIASKIDSCKGGHVDISSINDDSPSKSAANGNFAASQGENTSSEKKITASPGKTKQQSPPEKIISREPYNHQIIHDLSVQSLSEIDSTRDTVSVVQTEICFLDTKVNTISGGEQSKMTLGLGSNHENSELKNSPPLHISGPQSNSNERTKLGCNNHVPEENMDCNEPAQGDLDLTGTSIASVSTKMLHDKEADRENQNSSSKFLLAPLSSGPMVDKLIPIKEKETGGVRSKFFKRSEESESQLHKASSALKKISLSDSKRVGMEHSSPAEEKREGSDVDDTQIGSKIVGNSSSHAEGLTKDEHILLGSEKNVKDFSKIRNGSNAVGGQNGVGKSRQHYKEVTDDEPVLLGSEKKVNDHNSFGCQVNPSNSTAQTTKSSTHKCINPKLMVRSLAPTQNSKFKSVGGNKLSSLKAVRRTPDQASLKISRSTGSNNDLSNSIFQKEIKSLRNLEQNVEVQANSASKMVHSVGTEKQKLPTPPLKRKTYETSNGDLTLNPLKRLLESPSESRDKEASERVVEEQVCNHENLVDSNIENSICDRPISTLDIPREVNMTELEILSVMENDGNVEHAEAYTKELEDICNMLKKKHEEAKELLVRAIVTNNNLLMLNHPIYEWKKFAERLMSKELQT